MLIYFNPILTLSGEIQLLKRRRFRRILAGSACISPPKVVSTLLEKVLFQLCKAGGETGE